MAEQSGALATVDGVPITQQNMTRRCATAPSAFGKPRNNFDPKLLDTPEARAAILDQLVLDRALTKEAAQSNLVITADRLREFIARFQRSSRMASSAMTATRPFSPRVRKPRPLSSRRCAMTCASRRLSRRHRLGNRSKAVSDQLSASCWSSARSGSCAFRPSSSHPRWLSTMRRLPSTTRAIAASSRHLKVSASNMWCCRRRA